MVRRYLQVSAPTNGPMAAARKGNWECFVSYKLSVVHPKDPTKSVSRDSWHRFSARKKSHGWCDFAPAAVVLDAKSGYLIDDVLTVSAEIIVLSEQCTVARDDLPSGEARCLPL